jgi:hypothetical protein
VAILHGGLGTISSWEGWGLFGTQMKGFQALVSAMGDQYGGVDLGNGKNRKRMTGWGGVLQAEPKDDLQVDFKRDYESDRNDLPYQIGLEDRRHSTTEGGALYRFAPGWKVDVKATYCDTQLDLGTIQPGGYHTVEREGVARVEWDANSGLLGDLWAETGGRSSSGNFGTSALNRFDAAWGKFGLRLEPLRKASLDLSLGATRLGGLDLPVKGEPQIELEILPGEATRLRLHAKAQRTIPLFEETQGVAAYTIPVSGFSVPGFIRKEGGADLDRRLTDRVFVSIGGRAWDEDSHAQWTESDLMLNRPVWESLSLIRCWESRAGLKVDFGSHVGLQVDGRLSEAKNQSGDGRDVTGWPRQVGTAVLFRKTPKDYVGLSVKGAASREVDSVAGATLPPYWTLSLEAHRNLSRVLTIWAKGDNLTGQRYELIPGYPEPRFFARAGIELVF